MANSGNRVQISQHIKPIDTLKKSGHVKIIQTGQLHCVLVTNILNAMMTKTHSFQVAMEYLSAIRS